MKRLMREDTIYCGNFISKIRVYDPKILYIIKLIFRYKSHKLICMLEFEEYCFHYPFLRNLLNNKLQRIKMTRETLI